MTTPTPEAIEAAARAIHKDAWGTRETWEEAGRVIQSHIRDYAAAALSAAYPLMAAQAKAEAWDAGFMRGHITRSKGIAYDDGAAKNPYRAATIEGKDS